MICSNANISSVFLRLYSYDWICLMTESCPGLAKDVCKQVSCSIMNLVIFLKMNIVGVVMCLKKCCPVATKASAVMRKILSVMRMACIVC
jgi:hypothetical protein